MGEDFESGKVQKMEDSDQRREKCKYLKKAIEPMANELIVLLAHFRSKLFTDKAE
jgi:hypothetical protein